MEHKYLVKVDNYMNPFLAKNGYTLIKSEFVEEDHIWYLRLFIDLTEEEIQKRAEALAAKKAERAENLSAEEEDNALIGSTVLHEDEEPEEEGPEIPGIGINDCAKVSRYLSKWLDKEDFISEAYTLEVCSKGFLNSEDAETV